MTWPEVREALGHAEVAVIPVAALAQHGPAGTLGRDVARAEAFAKRLCARLHPRALLVPIQGYGLAPLQMGFAGSVTLRPTTYLAIYRSVVDSLYRHGLRTFLFLSATPSLTPALQSLANRVRADYPEAKMVYAAYSALAKEPRGEVAAFSEAMFLAPDTVRRDRLADAPSVQAAPAALGGLREARPWRDRTENGLIAGVSGASAAAGERMVAEALDALSDWLARYL